jgi:hypothetical protein
MWITKNKAISSVDKYEELYTKKSTTKKSLSTLIKALNIINNKVDINKKVILKQNIFCTICNKVSKAVLKEVKTDILKSTTSTSTTSFYIYNI